MDPATSTPPPVPPQVPSPARRGWWGRNWLWVVPTGCLTLVILSFAFAATIAIGVFGMIKSTDVYRNAVARARNDPRVTAAIGEPIKEGWYVGGSTQISGSSGNSDLTIPIHGPKGSATIYALATKFAGDWRYRKLIVKIGASGETIDLNEEGSESGNE